VVKVADLRIHPLPKQSLIYWATPPRIARLLRTLDLPPKDTGEPRLRCGQFDGAAREALQHLAQSAVDGLLSADVRANALTGRRAVILSVRVARGSKVEPLAELLPTGDAADLIDRARQRALSLVVHVPGAARDGALAFVTEYEFRWQVEQHYLARLFVRGSDTAQWETPRA
jgi:hypothetical protein